MGYASCGNLVTVGLRFLPAPPLRRLIAILIESKVDKTSQIPMFFEDESVKQGQKSSVFSCVFSLQVGKAS